MAESDLEEQRSAPGNLVQPNAPPTTSTLSNWVRKWIKRPQQPHQGDTSNDESNARPDIGPRPKTDAAVDTEERPPENPTISSDEGTGPDRVVTGRDDALPAVEQRPARIWIKYRGDPPVGRDGYTYAFNGINRPVPVGDIFFLSTRALILLRVAVKSGWIGLCLGQIVYLLTSLLVLSVPVIALQICGVEAVCSLPIPTIKSLWSFHRWPQWCCESIGRHYFLRKPSRAKFWWIVYFLLSNRSDFIQNYLNAWLRQYESPESCAFSSWTDPSRLQIIVDNDHLDVPIHPQHNTDSAVLQQLRMYYRIYKVKRGLLELIIPKKLVQINCVKINESSMKAEEVIGRLECGRGLQNFHFPEAVSESAVLATTVERLTNAYPSEGLEFLRRLDPSAVLGVIITPTVASLIAMVIWLSIYLRKTKENNRDVDVQVVVTTALTIGLYLVTAGSFVVALAAYIDSVSRETTAGPSESKTTEVSEEHKPEGAVIAQPTRD